MFNLRLKKALKTPYLLITITSFSVNVARTIEAHTRWNTNLFLCHPILTSKLDFICLCSFGHQSFVSLWHKTTQRPYELFRLESYVIKQNKLFVWSWQIHLRFWCSLKDFQRIRTSHQHIKAISLLLKTGSGWKCCLCFIESAVVYPKSCKENIFPAHSYIIAYTFSSRLFTLLTLIDLVFSINTAFLLWVYI